MARMADEKLKGQGNHKLLCDLWTQMWPPLPWILRRIVTHSSMKTFPFLFLIKLKHTLYNASYVSVSDFSYKGNNILWLIILVLMSLFHFFPLSLFFLFFFSFFTFVAFSLRRKSNKNTVVTIFQNVVISILSWWKNACYITFSITVTTTK